MGREAQAWFQFHLSKVETAAIQRVQPHLDEITTPPRQALQALDQQLRNAVKQAPLWSKVADWFGIPTRYYREIVEPLLQQLRDARLALTAAEERAHRAREAARKAAQEEYFEAHKVRKAERERRREAARIRYLERAPNLRSAQKALRVALIDQAMDAEGVVRCFYCTIEVEAAGVHVDHKTPIIRGGGNKLSNLALTCAPCNLAKGRKTEAEFRRRRDAMKAQLRMFDGPLDGRGTPPRK